MFCSASTDDAGAGGNGAFFSCSDDGTVARNAIEAGSNHIRMVRLGSSPTVASDKRATRSVGNYGQSGWVVLRGDNRGATQVRLMLEQFMPVNGLDLSESGVLAAGTDGMAMHLWCAPRAAQRCPRGAVWCTVPFLTSLKR